MMIEKTAGRLEEKKIEYKTKVQLKNYTSFKIGGPCEILILPHTAEEVAESVRICVEADLPVLFLGNGSNVLVSDQGFSGAVILFHHNFSDIWLLDETTVYAQAGASLARLCTFAQQNGLTGLEFAYGIPATVGGAAFMNAGAYGGEIKDVLQFADYLDENSKPQRRENAELDFSYRHSFFTGKQLPILGAAFSLKKGDAQQIRADMDEIYGRRKAKQPLEFPSAGSTFKRPEGAYAAALIEECGLKGRSVGGAQVSEKHSGFVINRKDATCRDVLDLIKIVQQTVKEKTGFTLECEVRKIGFEAEEGK